MRFGFGTQVMYHALDGKVYPAVILCRHNVPAEGDYRIAYEPKIGEVEYTHCWESSIKRMESSMLDLLEKERKRAMDIAYAAMEQHKQKHDAQKYAGNDLAFIENKLADECRIIGNTISGGDALSVTLGETVRDRLEKDYFATTSDQ